MIDFNSLTIPHWVNWIAQDEDGAWWGYQVEPLQQHNGWYENEVGQHIKLMVTTRNVNWQTTLKRLNC